MGESSIGKTGDVIPHILNSTFKLLTNDTIFIPDVPTKPKKKSRILSDIEGFERAHQWEIHTLLATLAVLSLFAIVANGLVLMVLLKNRNLRKMKNLPFIIMLTVSILNAAIYYSYILITYNSDFELMDKVCHYFYGCSIEVLYNVSLTTMLGMCVERLISVMEPLWFSTVWTENKYSMWINVAMVALGTVPTVTPLVTQFVEYHHSRGWMYCRMAGSKSHLMAYIWLNNCTIYIPSILGVVAVYIAVQVKATQARRMTRQFREECKIGTDKKLEAETGISMDKIKQSLYNARITIMLLCVFVGTKLPIAILSYAHYFHMKLPFSVRNCEFVGNVCRFFFCVLTPFLLPLMNTPLRNKVRELVCRKHHDSKSQRSTSYSNVENTVRSGNKTQRTGRGASQIHSTSEGV